MSEKTRPPFTDITAAPLLSKDKEDDAFVPVQQFLRRFGYLGDEAHARGRLDDPTSRALRRFQEFFGLPGTGEFDEATREQMTTHRCGLPDLADGVAFATTCAWPHPGLTIAFEDGTPDIGGASEFQAVRDACATWSAAAPVTFTETGRDQSPDVAVDWRPADDPDRSMVGGVIAHADFPPGCSVVTNALPKPVHFDDSEHRWVIGAVAGALDTQTVALHELGHILGLGHSGVAGSVMFPSVPPNFVRRELAADDLAGIRALYPPRVLSAGTYTVRQKAGGRFLDAHEIEEKDFRLVTRTGQNNDTQRWRLQPVGAVYTIRQKVNGRYLDAHEDAAHDFGVVTRTAQNNATQLWVAVPSTGGTHTIRQLSSGRFLDAHEITEKDFRLVTRDAQDNDTQRWLMASLGGNRFTILQKSNGRFVDAWEDGGHDFAVVTRPAQHNDTQRWILYQVGAVYTVQQKSNNRMVDAWEDGGHDFAVVTRPAQNNDTQRWVIIPSPGGGYTVQQLVNRRFLDAHQDAGNDFGVVTRPGQNNDTQRWLIDPA